jgi:hypothetical protein
LATLRALGIILLFAAAIKTYDAAVDSTTLSGHCLPPWLMLPVIEAEFFLGVWLLSSLWTAQARVAACVCFAVVALTQGIAGQRSCACLGQIELSPWIAFAFDVCAIGAIFLWRPVSERSVTALQLRAVLGIALAGGAGVAVVMTNAITETSHHMGLHIVPSLVDFGSLTQGGAASVPIHINNNTDETFAIEEMSSSCVCLWLQPSSRVVLPGERMSGELWLNLAHEPEFLGNLLMTLKLDDPSGHRSLTIQAKARVRPGA